jgi:CRISPR/Cas system-associated endonuclease Cas3-HD
MAKDNKDPKELIDELYTLFSSFKNRIEDPNYIQIEHTLKQLVDNQDDMKHEIRELKRQLLNPYDGVVIESKKNTEFRQSREKIEDDFRIKFEELRDSHNALLNWKSNFVKVSLVVISAMGGLITFLLNKLFA